jgi:hypothetical protein
MSLIWVSLANCQNCQLPRVYAGLSYGLLQGCNAKDEILTVVTRQTTSVWFNTFNFPKTEVGYYEKVGPLFKPWRTLK